jgi:hypothetical protein
MLVNKGIDLKPPVRKCIFIPALLLVSFVLFYPMLISIYVFAPLFIGTMAFILIEGVYKEQYLAIFVAVVYFVNLEVNLSLPLFFIVIISLMYYVLFYPSLKEIRRCRFCKPIISVIAINIMYVAGLLIHDFIFGTSSIVFDVMLWYALLADIFLVILL